ncbi:phage tail protein [Hymenobacter cellulosivorans]|uniref:Tail fiber protein n=1 Tax=Hymenobacter cellulosivorans TaxID=2932249 RepID=A0ABY4FDI7_9BACT|nr:tail fiber protein [Hymenobacter cellulosivorans]UOQ54117.1 tail fiber protein [Hymenobacter cellulosivorans]
MADFSASASGSAAGRRSLLQRFQRWLLPGAAQPRQLVSMRPNGNPPYIGEIAIFAGNFAPVGWEFCRGQLLLISENDTLFQLIGTTYGGDGESTFALPDLQGRVALHQGAGYVMAEMAGVESVTLTTQQIPSHTHTLGASSAPGTWASPSGAVPADSGSGSAQYTQATTNLVTQPAQLLGVYGGSQPHENRQPYVVINYIISLYGVFPSPT